MANFGVGVYLLTVIWFITLALCWVTLRTGHIIGSISVVVSFILTIIFVTVPRGEEGEATVANFYDKYYIPRYAILSFLLVSVLAGAAYCFVLVCLTPVETRKVKTFGSVG